MYNKAMTLKQSFLLIALTLSTRLMCITGKNLQIHGNASHHIDLAKFNRLPEIFRGIYMEIYSY